MRTLGFTERQARFLALVLEHSGVCVPRQYRASSGIAHGRHVHAFFAKLIVGGFATTDLAAPAHAGRIYHVQYKPWYRAVGEAGHRHRKPMSVGRAVGCLLLLGGWRRSRVRRRGLAAAVGAAMASVVALLLTGGAGPASAGPTPAAAAPAATLTKSSPVAGTTGVASTVLVQWTSTWVNAGYWVCADATVNTVCDTGWQPAGGAPYKQLSNLVAGVRYEWQVRADTAEAGSQHADGATWRTFSVAGVAPVLAKQAPAAGATGLGTTVTLQWTSGWTGATYAVCLDAVPNGVCDTSWTGVGGGGSYTRTGLRVVTAASTQGGVTVSWSGAGCQTTGVGAVPSDGMLTPGQHGRMRVQLARGREWRSTTTTESSGIRASLEERRLSRGQGYPCGPSSRAWRRAQRPTRSSRTTPPLRSGISVRPSRSPRRPRRRICLSPGSMCDESQAR